MMNDVRDVTAPTRIPNRHNSTTEPQSTNSTTPTTKLFHQQISKANYFMNTMNGARDVTAPARMPK